MGIFYLGKTEMTEKKKTFRQPTYSKPQISQDNKYLRITVPIFIPQHTHTHTHTHLFVFLNSVNGLDHSDNF